MDRGQIGVVSLGAEVRAAADERAGEGMHVARVPMLLFESFLNGAMVATSGFDDTDAVTDVVAFQRLSAERNGGVQSWSGDVKGEGFEQDVAVEVRDACARHGFSAVDGDDGEVFGTHLLDSILKVAARLLCRQVTRGTARVTMLLAHSQTPLENVGCSFNPHFHIAGLTCAFFIFSSHGGTIAARGITRTLPVDRVLAAIVQIKVLRHSRT